MLGRQQRRLSVGFDQLQRRITLLGKAAQKLEKQLHTKAGKDELAFSAKIFVLIQLRRLAKNL